MTLMIAAYSEAQAEQMRAMRAQLSAARDDADRQRQRATRIKAEHHHDIAMIGGQLLDEANDRQWCKDFDDFVDDLNRYLQIPLPLRERAFKVSAMVRLEITVSAISDSHARELGRDCVKAAEGTLDAMEGVTAWPDDSDDFEVELDG
ncbi:hypothetical protein ACFY36_51040 [Actinoplanes sp. NPDC000266]